MTDSAVYVPAPATGVLDSVKEAERWQAFAARSRRCAPLAFISGFRNRVRRGASCRMHDHPAVEIVFHRTGAGITRLEGRGEVSFGAHDVIIYGPHVAHDQWMREAGEDVCVQIALPPKEQRRVGAVYRVEALADTTLTEEILSLADGAFERTAAEQAVLDYRATAVLLALLRQLPAAGGQRGGTSAGFHVSEAEAYLRRNYRTVDSLQEVAAHIGLSTDHLRHVFRQERGISLKAFLTSLRLGRAKFLLHNTGLSLKEIADLSGFSNEYYFSTAFRRHAGVPPAQFRRDRGG